MGNDTKYLNQPYLINQYLYFLQLITKDVNAKRKSKKRSSEIKDILNAGQLKMAYVRFVK